VLASEITVFGRSAGQLTATGTVEVQPGAVVTGRVVSKSFILHPDAYFKGRVEPQHLDAALRVARFQERQREPGS